MGNTAVMFTDTVLSHHYLHCSRGERTDIVPLHHRAVVVGMDKCAFALLINKLYILGLFSGAA